MDIKTQDAVLIIASLCSVLACLILLWTYYRRKSKPVSLKMIATLSAIDCIASLSLIIFVQMYTIAGIGFSRSIFKGFVAGVENLSVLWSCNIARFVSRSITGNGTFDSNEYFKKSFIICCIVTFIIDCIEYSIDYFTQRMQMVVLVMSFTIALTSFYYLKAIRALKGYPIQFQQSVKMAVRNLYLFALAQILAFGPYFVIMTIQFIYPDMDLVNPLFIGMVLATLAGFANASIYLFTSKDDIDLNEQSIIEIRSSQMNSSQMNSLVEGKV